eukprot:evm.model.NODE_36432_length_17199_cov_28.734461.1
MTVLSAETSGPQPVPLAKHTPDPLPHHNEEHYHSHPHHISSHLSGLNNTASHQTGVSWGGVGMSERLGNHNRGASQFYHKIQHQHQQEQEQEQQQQQQQQQQELQRHLSGNNSLDESSSHGGAMDQDLPTAQLTQAQLFLLQEGTGSGSGPLNDIQQEQQQQSNGGQQEQQQMRNQISPDGLEAAEESTESVATELYGSSPSPEPHLLGHSRRSPPQRAQQQQQQQQKRQQERQQQEQQQEQEHHQQQQQQQQQGMVLPLPHLPGMVPSLVRAVSSSATLGARSSTIARGKDEAGLRGGMLSRSSSNTDLDMSCHGPADPNGYGGLHWTPAPLASFLSVSSWGSKRCSKNEEGSKD